MRVDKVAAGVYQIRGEEFYARIVNHGRQWRVQIRSTGTANIVCHCGIWKTLHDATEEAQAVLRDMNPGICSVCQTRIG